MSRYLPLLSLVLLMGCAQQDTALEQQFLDQQKYLAELKASLEEEKTARAGQEAEAEALAHQLQQAKASHAQHQQNLESARADLAALNEQIEGLEKTMPGHDRLTLKSGETIPALITRIEQLKVHFPNVQGEDQTLSLRDVASIQFRTLPIP